MDVKVLHPNGEVTSEKLYLYTNSPVSHYDEDTSFNVICEFIETDLSDSPICAKEKVLSTNKDFIKQYANSYTDEWFNNLCEDKLDSSDILMTEETFSFFDKAFERINDMRTDFCDAFKRLNNLIRTRRFVT
jgi:hypothetical protein